MKYVPTSRLVVVLAACLAAGLVILLAVALVGKFDGVRSAPSDDTGLEDNAKLADGRPLGVLEEEEQFGQYAVRIYRDPDTWQSALEVLRNGRRVYGRTGGSFRIGVEIGVGDSTNPLTTMGRDITGDGIPNLVATEWTGGAHCCLVHYIFEIGDEFRLLAVIDARDSEITRFEDLNGDSSLEIFLYDWTFAYWKYSFAYSPGATVILQYRHGAYRPAADLMYKPPPSAQELRKEATLVRGHERWTDGWPPSSMWSYMLDLMYSGHADLALHFFDMAWPPEVPGKADFLHDFETQLANSPYWPEIQALSVHSGRAGPREHTSSTP